MTVMQILNQPDDAFMKCDNYNLSDRSNLAYHSRVSIGAHFQLRSYKISVEKSQRNVRGHCPHYIVCPLEGINMFIFTLQYVPPSTAIMKNIYGKIYSWHIFFKPLK